MEVQLLTEERTLAKRSEHESRAKLLNGPIADSITECKRLFEVLDAVDLGLAGIRDAFACDRMDIEETERLIGHVVEVEDQFA